MSDYIRGFLILGCIGLVLIFFQDRRRNRSLDEIRVKHNLPALGVSIFSRFDSDAYVVGRRNYNSKEKAQESDKFHLGSCTKVFTATLFAIFVEGGKISFQTRIQDVFPEFPIHEDLKNVTMDMLLQHQSGIVSDLDSDLKMKIVQCSDGDVMMQRKLAALEMLKLAPEKVDQLDSSYSNNGYILLGAVMEKVSQLPWEELIRRKIFEPLRMRNAGFGNPCKDSSVIDQPWPHSGDKYPNPVDPGNTFENYQSGVVSDNPAFYGPATGIHCSIGNLRSFLREQCFGLKGNGELLSGKMYRKMYDGVETTRNNCIVIGDGSFGCMGSNTLNCALFAIKPENSSGYIAVTNFAGKDMIPARKALSDAVSFMIEEKTED